MWATLDLLVRREARGRDLTENVEEWLEGVNRKIAASADGEEEVVDKKTRRKKGVRGKCKAAEEEAGGEKTVADPTPAQEDDKPSPSKPPAEDGKTAGINEEEETESRKGIRVWNPKKGKRSHDREIGQRVENLMGTSVIRFTDRKYMMQLQERILESHYKSTEKRMNNRMNEEIEREKRLILDNKMPMTEASGLSTHPVFVVKNGITSHPRVVALNASGPKKRFAKTEDMEAAIMKQEEQEMRMDVGGKDKKTKRSKKGSEDKESLSKSSQSRETVVSDKASMKVLLDLSEFRGNREGEEKAGRGRARGLQRTPAEDRCGPRNAPHSESSWSVTRESSSLLEDYIDDVDWDEDADDEDMIPIQEDLSEEMGYSPSIGSRKMAEEDDSKETPCKELEKLKYEAPLVKELRRAETVDQLYELAEQIVGPVPPCTSTK